MHLGPPLLASRTGGAVRERVAGLVHSMHFATTTRRMGCWNPATWMDVKVIIWRGLAAALLDETRRNDGGPRGRIFPFVLALVWL